MRLLKREAASGALVVAVLHDLAMAARYCDHLVLLRDGKIMISGTPSEVLTPENLRAVYGITARIDFSGAVPHLVSLDRCDPC